MHQGRVIEEGSHDELLLLRGTYWRLVQLQFSEENGEGESGVIL
jgi:ABC-type multidrug transport system fused ATPase/permease subunit